MRSINARVPHIEFSLTVQQCCEPNQSVSFLPQLFCVCLTGSVCVCAKERKKYAQEEVVDYFFKLTVSIRFTSGQKVLHYITLHYYHATTVNFLACEWACVRDSYLRGARLDVTNLNII